MTLNDLATSGAASQSTLPACFAVTVHVPTSVTLTVAPLTAQTFVGPAVNDTDSPELAVAETLNGASPNTRSGNPPNEIV